MTQNQQPTAESSRLCTATCADGSPCRAWAVRGSDPPRCAPHGGGAAPVGAPLGNQNARTHGAYARTSLSADPTVRARNEAEAAIADLCVRHLRLYRYIESHKHELPVSELVRLCQLYARNLSRLVSRVQDRYGGDPHVVANIKPTLARLLRHRDVIWEDPL